MTVRKLFSTKSSGGASTNYWENTWAAMDLPAARSDAAKGSLSLLLDSHLKNTAGPVLEAGCGSGIIAMALESFSHSVVGIDLAQVALHRAKLSDPEFRGTVGDIREMPFATGAFGAVVSLGVLEHDESGPEPALADHFRVLQSGGLLLVTVPRISPLKSLRDTWNLTLMRRRGYISRRRWAERRAAMGAEPSSRPFHQYEFKRSDWSRLVQDAGFTIVSQHPLAVGSGLGDLSKLIARRPVRPQDNLGPAGQTPARSQEILHPGLAQRHETCGDDGGPTDQARSAAGPVGAVLPRPHGIDSGGQTIRLPHRRIGALLTFRQVPEPNSVPISDAYH
ncbi:MAG: class I SAM-dependent methyltransferase [Candidatus Microthrix sp.]|nr:class I SAM-dependent methyltransferase [Candidatus Microthrix sp.]